jgi:hypothetical protein
MYKIILIILFTSLAVGCKKEKEAEKIDPLQKSERFSILTSRLWKRTDMRIGSTSYWHLMTNCDKDDIDIFRPGLDSMITDEGPIKCSPVDPQLIYYKWQFINNESGLVFIQNSGERDTFQVVEVSVNRLRLGEENPKGLLEHYFEPLE